MSDWQESADALETLLDSVDRIASGIDASLPDEIELRLTGAPDDETMARLRGLLARTALAQQAVAERMAETGEELRRVDRLRHVGQRYLAF
jgi:hypothetical protein